MTDREAMQLALEALENVTEDYVKNRQYKHNKAIAALEKRLAQPEQKPVPPPWWPAVENILNEYGLQAIDFVADFKKALAQSEREWVGLTDEDKHYLNEVLNLQGRFPIIDAIEAILKEKNT